MFQWGDALYCKVSLTVACYYVGTHGLENFTITEQSDCTVALNTVFSKDSTASGALLSFVFITDSGDVDLSASFHLALDRNTSHNHTLPFDLYPGQHHVYIYAYDIEYGGTLNNGVEYPATLLRQ